MSFIDLYFALGEKEREVVRTAVKSGDNPTTRQVLQTYFPRVAPEELGNLINYLRGVEC